MTVKELKLANSHGQPIAFADPVFARTPLPHRATFFPLGFPVEVQTNSPEVLDCAAESWLGYPHLFDREPIRIRVLLHPHEPTELPPTPVVRAHGHILTNVADAHHHSTVDLLQRFAFIATTSAALRHPSYFRYFFLEAAALSPIATQHATAIHAACVELDGKGLLLCGDSGAGKSTLSYACARAGWTYITDDASFLLHGRSDRLVVGNFRQVRFRPSAIDLFPVLNGSEVIRRAEVGKPSIELFTSAHRELKRAATSHISHIVFLNREPVRKPVRRPRLNAFPREVAQQYMLQTSSWLPAFHQESATEINSFLGTQPLELHYSDLPAAIDMLTGLVHKGHP